MHRLSVVCIGGLFTLGSLAVPGWVHAQARTPMSDNDAAMPGLAHVPLASHPGRGPGLAATTGYAMTERQADGDGTHHRALLGLALSLPVGSWLQLGLKWDGRLDRHSDGDAGAVGDSRLLVRAGQRLGESVSLGAQLGLWLVGANPPLLKPDATTVDGRLLFSLHPSSSFVLAASTGYRLDQSAKAAPAGTLSQNDSLSLGLSEFNSVLFGAGGMYQLADSQFLAEFSGELLVGQGAPTGNSPMRIMAGVRHALSESVQIEALVAVGLSGRPGLDPDTALDPVIPIEPRARFTLGLRYRPAPVLPQPAPVERETRPKPASSAPDPSHLELAGQVRREAGDPIAAARVELTIKDQSKQATTDADGGFALAEVPFGEASLRVLADGYEPYEQALTLTPEAKPELALTLIAKPPAGQLRGLVRSFRGEGVSAAIRVEPLGLEFQTDEEGRFETDIPPGTYSVTVQAEGYRSQKRRARVDEDGVTVLNVDLRKKRKRAGRGRGR